MHRRSFLMAATSLAGAAMLPDLAAAEPAPPAAASAANPLLAPWRGPNGGVPPFDRVRIADIGPALDAALAESETQVDAIAANPAAPSFENTVAQLERSGHAEDRVGTIYGVWTSTLSNPEVQALETAEEPKLAQHYTRLLQNDALFHRLDTVYQARDAAGLTPEQKRLSWLYWNNRVRAGARLAADSKARIATINQELARNFTTFNQNLLADEAGYVLYLTTQDDLRGLPPDVLAGAASAAADRGHPGQHAVLNTRSSVDPFLTYSDRRDLRERVWRSFYARGDSNDVHDNKQVIRQILRLRAERAQILGYPTHAHWRLEVAMARTPEAAMGLMMRVWPSAIARVHEEVAEMQAIADREHAGLTIEPWDYRYYAEKVRLDRYALDLNEVKQYLQLEKVREGMFWAAGQLYGFTFAEVHDLPTARPDIRVFQVRQAENGPHVGYWYFDPYARVGKRSGAWMNQYRPQSTFDGPVTTIVSNNANFVPGAPNEPVLLAWDDAITMFHEFGHGLHALNSQVRYPSLAGTAVVRDYVEFPSQMNERWLPSPEVLSRFALHYRTGAPMPQELRDKITRARTFRQGFDVTELLASALVDMKIHLAGGADIDPAAFERAALAELRMPRELPMRHRLPQFGHIFASDNYSAGYYSYIWAEVLSTDAVEAFREAPGGLYDPGVAQRLRREIMRVGNSVEPAIAYRNFRGRDPDVAAYLRDKGFPTT